jgi:nitrogen regulatory protein PII
MKQVDGIIFTKDMERLSQALEAKGFIVYQLMYNGSRAINSGILKGVAYIYSQIMSRVMIKIVIDDNLVGTLTDTLRGIGECSLDISTEVRVSLA